MRCDQVAIEGRPEAKGARMYKGDFGDTGAQTPPSRRDFRFLDYVDRLINNHFCGY